MCWIGNEKQLRRVLFSECEFLMDIVSGVWQWTTMMVKLNYNYSHCSTTATRIKNVASLFASSTLQRWTILLLLLYKLDYKDYYCYGSSSSSSNSAIFNNENGKKIFSLDLFSRDIKCYRFLASLLIHNTHLLKVNILSRRRFATRRASLFFQKGSEEFSSFLFTP